MTHNGFVHMPMLGDTPTTPINPERFAEFQKRYPGARIGDPNAPRFGDFTGVNNITPPAAPGTFPGGNNPLLTIEDLEESDLGLQMLWNSMPFLQGKNPLQQHQFQSLFQPTFNRYLGQLGSMVRNEQDPTMSFSDFLKNQFNPQREMFRFNSPGGVQARGQTAFRF